MAGGDPQRAEEPLGKSDLFDAQVEKLLKEAIAALMSPRWANRTGICNVPSTGEEVWLHECRRV